MTDSEKISVGVGVAVIVAMLGILVGMSMSHEPTPKKEPTSQGQAPVDIGEKQAVISSGEAVEISDYLRDDVRTVVEFTAEW